MAKSLKLTPNQSLTNLAFNSVNTDSYCWYSCGQRKKKMENFGCSKTLGLMRSKLASEAYSHRLSWCGLGMLSWCYIFHRNSLTVFFFLMYLQYSYTQISFSYASSYLWNRGVYSWLSKGFGELQKHTCSAKKAPKSPIFSFWCIWDRSRPAIEGFCSLARREELRSFSVTAPLVDNSN